MSPRRWAGLALVAALGLAAPPAHADTPPSLWDSVKSPGARDRYALHVQAQRTLAVVVEMKIELQRFGLLDHLRAVLEENGAATSPDVRLRFDLGETYERLELHENAIRVLGPALAAHEDHPAALSAMNMISFAYAKLNRRREERDAYRMYLRHETDPYARLSALGNLAEAEMGLLDMRAAIAGYDEVIALGAGLSGGSAQVNVTLAEWGLSVALDRAGDRGRAKAEAKRAIALDPGMRILNGPNVFFVPQYERLWYIALGAAAAAGEADTPKEALELRQVVETCFVKYITLAKPDDPWLALAKLRLAEAEKARVVAEKKLAAAKKARPPEPDQVLTF